MRLPFFHRTARKAEKAEKNCANKRDYVMKMVEKDPDFVFRAITTHDDLVKTAMQTLVFSEALSLIISENQENAKARQAARNEIRDLISRAEGKALQ